MSRFQTKSQTIWFLSCKSKISISVESLYCLIENQKRRKRSDTHIHCEFHFFPKFRPRPPLYHILVGSELIPFITSATNLGVTFDETLSFEEHVQQVCRSSFFHLRNISIIRKYLTRISVEVLIHVFVTSKLDYCNSLSEATVSPELCCLNCYPHTEIQSHHACLYSATLASSSLPYCLQDSPPGL